MVRYIEPLFQGVDRWDLKRVMFFWYKPNAMILLSLSGLEKRLKAGSGP
jgi:hypothetical protein